jgi:hypothetical protein
VSRLEVRKVNGDAVVGDRVAQHIDSAAGVELGGKPPSEAQLGREIVSSVTTEDQLGPLLWLSIPDELKQLDKVEAQRPIEVLGK